MKKAVISLILLLSTSIVLGLTTTQFIQKHGLVGILFESTNIELNVYDSQSILVKRDPSIGDFLEFESKAMFIWGDAYLLDDNYNIIDQYKLLGNKYPSSNWVEKSSTTPRIGTGSLKAQDYHFASYICNLHPNNLWATKGPWDCKWEIKSVTIKNALPQPPVLPTPKSKYGLSDPNNLGPKHDPNVKCVRPNDGDKIDKDTTLCKDVYNFKIGLQLTKSGITLDCNDATLDGDDNGQRSERGIWHEQTGGNPNGGNFYTDQDLLEKVIIKNCNIKNYESGIAASFDKSFFLNNNFENNRRGVNVWEANKIVPPPQGQTGLWLTSIQQGDNVAKNNIFKDNNYIGLGIYNSENNLLENNLFENNGDGAHPGNIYGIVKNNLFKNNQRVAVYTLSEAIVENNEFIGNGQITRIDQDIFHNTAVFTYYSTIKHNYFKDNAKAITTSFPRSVIKNNLIEDSTVGGIVYETTSPGAYQPTIIKNNEIKNNPYGIYAFDTSNSKTPQRIIVEYNDLIDNKVQVFTDYFNFIDKNYYSDYSPTCDNNNPKDDYCDDARDIDGGVTKDEKPLAVKASSLQNKKGSANCVTPTDGMQIDQDTKFCPGFYNLKKGVEIIKEKVVLDCDGATLNGLIRQTSQNGKITYIVSPVGIGWYGINEVEVKNCNLEFYGSSILSESSNNDNVHDNEISMSEYGIQLLDNSNTRLHTNRIISTYTGEMIKRGSVNVVNNNFLMYNNIGIHALHSSSNNIKNNEIYYSRFTAPVTMDTAPQFNVDGIAIALTQNSEHNKATSNIIDHNKIGVYVESSNNNLVNENQIQYSVGSGTYNPDGMGIYVTDKSGGETTENKFIHNLIQNNDKLGVITEEYSGGGIKNNKFWHNNFIKNGDHEVDWYPNQWDDGSLGNYWDDHYGTTCNDSDNDGICNNPRPIHSGSGLQSNKNDNYPSANII